MMLRLQSLALALTTSRRRLTNTRGAGSDSGQRPCVHRRPSDALGRGGRVRGDRIADVGTNAVVRQRAGSGTRVIDVGGRVVIPGINDAHTHVGARPPGTALKLSDDPTLDDVIEGVRTRRVFNSGRPVDLRHDRRSRAARSEGDATRVGRGGAWPARETRRVDRPRQHSQHRSPSRARHWRSRSGSTVRPLRPPPRRTRRAVCSRNTPTCARIDG